MSKDRKAIRSFFDAVNQEWLLRFLNHRIGDPRILRLERNKRLGRRSARALPPLVSSPRVGPEAGGQLIQKWLRAGVLEDGVVSVGETGTGQGSVISPLLANVYLHYVFDLWAERWRRREATGNMVIVRYADDIVVGFEREVDAGRFRDGWRSLR